MSTASKSSSTSGKSAGLDANQLLKADHREVEGLFEKFEAAKGDAQKRKIAQQICDALTVHAQIEEELYYPACERAGVEEDLLAEAKVEHQSAKELIAQIQAGRAVDEMWEAKVKVLQEQIEHHVKEEEGAGGIMAKAKKSSLDLEKLGAALQARKEELMAAKA